MTAVPYIGVTGAVSVPEVDFVLNAFSSRAYTLHSPHIPMLGFLVSYKTLNGQETANRRYPAVSAVPALVRAASGRCLPMIHYNSRERETLDQQIGAIFNPIYQQCSALQLNVPWPEVQQLARIKEKFPRLEVVLQLSQTAMDGKSRDEIVAGVKSYGESIAYVLIDPSGGRGRDFDLEHSVSLYLELRSKVPTLGVGFAGGFTAENLRMRVSELIRRTSETAFCIDAEGGLRDKISKEYGDDLLNMDKVQRYIDAACTILP